MNVIKVIGFPDCHATQTPFSVVKELELLITDNFAACSFTSEYSGTFYLFLVISMMHFLAE